MAGFVKNIIKMMAVMAIVPGLAFGVQAQNPRGGKVVSRNQASDTNSSIRRSATSVIARSTALNNRKNKMVVVARPGVARAASTNSVRSGAKVVSGSANVSRVAVSKSSLVRGATKKATVNTNKAGLSRAGKARATAVFNDVTKIGGAYSACHDAYATCMDQFCANANDTYRRCFCSDRFADFRDMSDNLDNALNMLADFQNNNLNAIDKTAAEVTAMYSSTAGEDAIKKDTSASQQMLNEIGDILSGKKTTSKNMSTASIGVLNFGDLSDVGDIWSDSGSSVFNSRSADNISALEGRALYQRAASQCSAITRETCSGDAMFNLASSAYSVLVNQDCNVFEKSVNAKKENVMQVVRQAEKLLRDARLEEYRAHNDPSFNACLSRVEEEITQSGACGPDYIECLDYTHTYIRTDGTPNPTLFKLTSIAPVLSDGDIIKMNSPYDKMLEEKKKFVTQALDTCRDISDDVWTEFKRNAIIRIAQAQDDTIENFKDSCVQTIKECYNTDDETLADLTADTVSDKKLDTSAGRAIVVRDFCQDKVMACAAMYGDADGCVYNRSTRKIEAARENANCGLKSLLAYVNTVDSARVAQGCETALTAYAKELCAGTGTKIDQLTGGVVSETYPDGCTLHPFNKKQIRASLTEHAKDFCALDLAKESGLNLDVVERVIKNLFDELGLAWNMNCEKFGGVWYEADKLMGVWTGTITEGDLNKDFYTKYYGGTSLSSIVSSINGKLGDIGACINQSAEKTCKSMFGDNAWKNGQCDVETADKNWYSNKCKLLANGTLSGDSCTPGGGGKSSQSSNNKSQASNIASKGKDTVATASPGKGGSTSGGSNSGGNKFGGGNGGFTLSENLSLADKMNAVLGKGESGGVISPVGNVVGDYSNYINYQYNP